MSISKLGLVIVIVGVLYGCAGQVALLKNDKGEIAKCEVTQGEAMWSGVIIRDMTVNNCVAEYEKAGYKRINGN